MVQLLKKAYFFLRSRITYYQVVSLLFICILVMGYFTLPFFIDLFQKKIDLSLQLPENTIPFLVLEKAEKNSTFTTFYLAFWDISSGKVYRDDVQSICEVNGDIDRVFWTGNKQIILTPLNERGAIEVVNQDSSYQILVKQIKQSDQTIIKPSYDGKRVYQLSVDPVTKSLLFVFQSGKKEIKHEISLVQKYSDYSFVKPIYLFPENLEPVILCFFESKSNPEKGLGILEGTVKKNKIDWNLHQEMKQSISLANVHDCNFSDGYTFISHNNDLNIEQLINNLESRPLSSANNDLSMFHNYLFGKVGESKIFNPTDVVLVEKGIRSPTLSVFNEFLLIHWEPSFTSNKDFFIKHIIAQNEFRSAGRMEVYDGKIRLYRDTILLREEVADKRYLDSQWVFPNE